MTDIQRRIQAAYSACYRLCSRDHNASAYLTYSLEAARMGQRGHRQMGARFTRGQAAYRLPIADAARFFAVRWFLDDKIVCESAAAACGLREDALYGLGARDLMCQDPRWRELRTAFRDVLELDYSEVFAE